MNDPYKREELIIAENKTAKATKNIYIYEDGWGTESGDAITKPVYSGSINRIVDNTHLIKIIPVNNIISGSIMERTVLNKSDNVIAYKEYLFIPSVNLKKGSPILIKGNLLVENFETPLNKSSVSKPIYMQTGGVPDIPSDKNKNTKITYTKTIFTTKNIVIAAVVLIGGFMLLKWKKII